MRDASACLASRLFLLTSLVLGASVAACAAPSGPEEALGTSYDALGEAGTIRFAADFSERVEGEITKGKTLRIAYDTARLPRCRGEQGGRPQWAINGYWRIGDGPVRTFEAGGLSPSGVAEAPVLALDASGELQIWFQNTNRWGCNTYDSDYGNNYRFQVAPAAHEPGWLGDVRYAISRPTCDGKACDGALRPVPEEIVYDSWARQRAAVRVLTFEVWKKGVTDFDNPDLWRQLDVQMHSRVQGTTAFESRYVDLDARRGNNARYAVDLTALDPLPGFRIVDPARCPAFPLLASAGDGGVVEGVVELYFTVNGVELRPAGGGEDGLFRVRYQQVKDLYALCMAS